MQFTSSDLQVLKIYSSLMVNGIFGLDYKSSTLSDEDYQILLREQLLKLNRGIHGTVRDLEEAKKQVADETLALCAKENRENSKVEEARITEFIKGYKENLDNVLFADYKSVLTEGAVLVNAHSTQEFIEQAEKNQGKVLEGHLVNVDFKEVEEHFKKNGLEMPEIGAARLENCDFRGCEELKVPYEKAYLEEGCKTNETEKIREQLMEIKGVENLDVQVGYRPAEGIMRMKGEFYLTAMDVVDGKETHLASFKLSEMPKDRNYKEAFMEHLRNNIVDEEKKLQTYEVIDTLTENRKRSMMHRADVFYNNINVKKEVTFKNKEEAVKFVEFMSKRAEALAKDDFNGMGKHWNYEAIQFSEIAETMKRPDYDLNRCEQMINHPELPVQGFMKVQRDAWVVKNESDMKKSINQVKKAEKALIDEQKRKDERFFGLGKYWERTVNRKEYESRNFKIQSMRKDRTAMEKNLKSFTENNYARANAQFDTKLMGCFKDMKDTLRSEKPKVREIKTVERVQTKVQEKTISREKG